MGDSHNICHEVAPRAFGKPITRGAELPTSLGPVPRDNHFSAKLDRNDDLERMFRTDKECLIIHLMFSGKR